MSEDAGAAAGTAAGGSAGTTTDPASTAGTAPAADDRSPEEVLADAASDAAGDADPANALAAAQAEAKKWRDLSRKNETQARANAEAAKKWADAEDATKTEIQRATDRAAAAEQKAAQSEQRYLRTMAAASYSLPVSLIGSIGGSTEDEINASAEELAREWNETVEKAAGERAKALAEAQAGQRNGGQRPAPRRPVESLRPGAMPADDNPGDPDAWIRDLARR